MNKAALRDRIIAQLHADLANQTTAALLARDEAINEESRAESKYDTHSQEAAYLAEGQARIAAEIQASIAFYQTFTPAPFSLQDPIALGALVELTAKNQPAWFFIGPSAGGTEVLIDGQTVLVITPASPVGRQLLGRRVGDSILSPSRGGTAKQTITGLL